jgi:acyl carrier protein
MSKSQEFNSTEFIDRRLCASVKRCLGLRVTHVELSHRLVDDLRCDSIDHVEIAMKVEDCFGIVITDDEAADCATVADYSALVRRKLRTAFPIAGGAECAAS